MRDAAVAAVRAAITGDEAQAETAREEAAQAIVAARGVTIEEARTQVADLEAQYRQTTAEVTEQVTEVADTATDAVSSGMLFGAIGLILGAIAAWFGGRAGAVDPTLTARQMPNRSAITTTTRR
ncbi:hypothetical protein [Cypionkella sp.]|uniref:hypothetical protein n=1 Tax=Cypionkella sp. TaxID=2811411 RepID=UPI00260BC93F|nr:hypothetical protein [Cypionkella sp.]MDB5667036.1 PhnA-like protein [Cypionkella sp.]